MMRSMHTNVLWIASKNLSTVLGKLSKFSTVNTDPDDEKIKINLDQNFHLNFAHFCSSQWGPLHMGDLTLIIIYATTPTNFIKRSYGREK